MTTDTSRSSISVIIPILNEASNVSQLHGELIDVLENMNVPYELIFIDDGSEDESFSILSDLASDNDKTTVIQFRRRFGQTAAMVAGIDHSSGEIIITMDGDLQNDPRDIPRLVEKLQEGYDIVSGWRKDRKDAFVHRRLPSIIANRMISKLTGVHLHDYGCTLKAYSATVLKSVKLYGEMHRFIPALASWLGVEVAEIPVNHRPRVHGKSKYDISRTVRVILDLVNVKFLITYKTRPIQVFGFFGVLSFVGSFVGMLVVFILRFYGVDITGNPLFLISIVLFLMGMQFVTMGLLGEIITRTYHETQNKQIYAVRKIVGPDSASRGV
jgi:glycosyltransferase involved in cell wall biosynthesis